MASKAEDNDAGSKNILKILGPGLVTGAADDDPSGIATYSQVGAQFGYGMGWTVILSFPLMVAIQEVAAHIGVVTGSGISRNVKQHYPRWLLAAIVAPDRGTLLAPWQDGPWLGLTVILTVFCTVGSFSLMNAWQPKITATEAGLIYCIEPIFGSIMACFLPAWFSAWGGIHYDNETATWTLLMGGGLITIANVLLQLKPPAKAP